MTGETRLATLLRTLQPELHPGCYVFCTLDASRSLPAEIQPLASLREREGLSVVLPQGQADQLGLSYEYLARWITLQVHSSLAAVGLTATFSTALATAGISCNVIAGYHHDHLFVAEHEAQRALDVLLELSEQPR
ncbi:ACT domain-containing protein [Stutzerimonas azotifigens]|uniref:ACT domain-containing protein n=1 Tax=Stutzerimonas azotifigens TaxID=291995 RepID=A0ABR5YWJ2_9GAMM|nr:ACT domain-containing protein [Stutzerimonas azotifigens]MBA1272317.1 ACT domain-containing protein [Stutzerimonas azotifigens]